MSQSRIVLIVDDSPEDRELYRRYLLRDREYSYTFLEATLGEQGLELWQQHQPDAVLIDYLLPDLDGLEFLAQLQLSPQQPCLPVIMVTGVGNEAIAVQAMKAGAQDYLVKEQITPERLQLAVNGAIETVQLRIQLWKSEERLQVALAASRMGIWDWNIQTGEITWSDNLEALFGLETGEFDGSFKMFTERLHPDDHDRVLRAIDHAIATGEDYDIEFRVVYPNGTIRWALSQGKVFYDQNGQPMRMAGNDIDITERKRSAEILHNSEERFRQLAENIDAVFWMKEVPENRVCYVSPAYESLWGLNPQLLYKNQQSWVDHIHPEDRESTNRAFHEKAVTGEFDQEYRIVLADGSIRWVRDRCFPLRDESGKIYRFAGIAEDITSRKHVEQALRDSEERFRMSVENMLDCFGIYTAVRNEQGQIVDFRVEYVNDAACINNYMNREQQIGRGLCEILPGHRDSELFAEYCQVVETGQSLVKESLVYQDEYGQQCLVRAFDIRVAKLGDGFIATWRDITDRKRTEETLRENEQLLRLALTGAHAGSWSWEIQTNKLIWSPEVYDLYGLILGNSSLQYEDWYNALHPQDRDRANADVLRVIEQRLPELYTEFRIVHPQRGTRWLVGLGRLTFNEQGEPIRLSGINLDITERKQAEEVLRQSEEFKHRMLESSSDCIKVLDLDGRLLYMNTGGMCLLEIDDITCHINTDWTSFWQGDDRTAAEAALPTARAGNVSRFQGFCPTAKGTPKWWDIAITPIFDNAGHVCQLLATSRDITEQKQAEADLRESEERFRTLADNMSQFAWMADENGWIFWYNQRWFDYTGTTLEEMQGWGWQKVHHPEHVDRVVEYIRHCFETGQLWEDTFPLRGQDGQYRWFLSRAIPIRDQQGKVLRWFGTNTDITERQQAEQERDRLLEQEQLARAEAERANRVKDEFLAILSHELRSPLNPILGWTKLLQSRKFDEHKTAEALAIIERNAKLQTQLIDDLLDIAKILRGKLNIDATPVHLALVIEAAIDTVKTAAVSKSILLHSLLPDIGEVSGDSTRLQQIVWNLLSNAIKFTPTGGRVEIRLEQVNDQAHIIVSDTGKGIKPDFLPHIFESFQQEDVSITRRFGGLGLGLAIVRYLVEAHGGTIGAESPGEGKGATFTVRLPLLNAKPQMSSTDDFSESELDLTGIRVLIVDDEADARELLTVLLTQYGADVLTVTSAAEVLAVLESFQPNVLISDIGMPDVDGYTLLQQIRSLPPKKGGQIPAIALTAYARQEDQQRAVAVGFQHHFSKPFDLDGLVQAVFDLARFSFPVKANFQLVHKQTKN
ncbi:hypothetical protein AMR41_29385 [Hapalosiphon sp. MRB220]|nr:hypothetical protein AMR41_29385 [Hapalosiphon sp. MRB220]